MKISSKFFIEYSTVKILSTFLRKASMLNTNSKWKKWQGNLQKFSCGRLKAIAAVRHIENLVKTARFHFAVSTGQTLSQYPASNSQLSQKWNSPTVAAFPHMAHYFSYFMPLSRALPKYKELKDWRQHLPWFDTPPFLTS